MNNATVRQCKVCGLVKPLASVRRSRGGGHICLRCAAHRRRGAEVADGEDHRRERVAALNTASEPIAEAGQHVELAIPAPVAAAQGVQRRNSTRRHRTRTARKGRYAGHWGAAVRDLGALVLVLLSFFGLWLWVTSRL
jgi:hypothetical protein